MTTIAKPAPPQRAGHKPANRPGGVYALELPVRLAHWTIFLSCLVLSLTGWWIGRASLPETPAGPLAMQEVRFIHILAGWVLISAVLLRVYWLFAGNRYASWREWVPSSWARVKEIVGVLKYYLFLSKEYPAHGAGHNVLAGLSYTGIYAVFFFMFLSGVALEGTGRADDWHTWVAWPVAWIEPQLLRFLHHLGMWIVWIFVTIHVCISTLVDHETRGNVYSAIVSGWRAGMEEDEGEEHA